MVTETSLTCQGPMGSGDLRLLSCLVTFMANPSQLPQLNHGEGMYPNEWQ
jgi:hypothetical protein